jgi:BirA family biotin operon repressor/biotin-[acetyl-CoA-carboxylase] ligase
MSLILRPERPEGLELGELTVLGALAVVEALDGLGVQAWIKWPNDVLIAGGKTAGILVESGWLDGKLLYSVMGIGINVKKGSLREKEKFEFPAACLEDELGVETDRLNVIHEVLKALSGCYKLLGTGKLIKAWDKHLAFKGQTVRVSGDHVDSQGKLLGVTERGQLRLQIHTGEVLKIGVGLQQLRPVDRN